MVGDRDVARLVETQRLQHFELQAVLADIVDLILRASRARGHQRLRVEGLELDDVGARIGGHIDQLQCQIERAVMIYSGFGDDDCRVHRPYETPNGAKRL